MSGSKKRLNIVKMLKKVREFFVTPQIHDALHYDLEMLPSEKVRLGLDDSLFFPETDAMVATRNAQKLETKKLDQEREIANKNLKMQHRVMVATVVGTLVALVSSIIALYVSSQNEQPIVNVTNVLPTDGGNSAVSGY